MRTDGSYLGFPNSRYLMAASAVRTIACGGASMNRRMGGRPEVPRAPVYHEDLIRLERLIERGLAAFGKESSMVASGDDY